MKNPAPLIITGTLFGIAIAVILLRLFIGPFIPNGGYDHDPIPRGHAQLIPRGHADLPHLITPLQLSTIISVGPTCGIPPLRNC